MTTSPYCSCSFITTNWLELNIKRAHYMWVLMTNCVTGKLPNMDPWQFGWELEKDGKLLKPKMLPDRVDIAPKAVLEFTGYTCKVSNCKTNQCSCAKAKIPCSDFCGWCKGDQEDVKINGEYWIKSRQMRTKRSQMMTRSTNDC